MEVKLIAVVLALAGAFAYSKVTHRARLQEALRAPSQFGENNAARDDGKPLLMSVLLPGCPWAAHANDLLAGAKELRRPLPLPPGLGRGHHDQRQRAVRLPRVEVHRRALPVSPDVRDVEQLDEMLPADQLKTAMTAFAGGYSNQRKYKLRCYYKICSKLFKFKVGGLFA